MNKRLTYGKIEEHHKQRLLEIEQDFLWQKQKLYEEHHYNFEVAWLWKEEQLAKLNAPVIIKTPWGVLFG